MKISNKSKHIAIISGIVVVALVGGFFAGMKYQQSKLNTRFRTGPMGNQRMGAMGTFRPTTGDIVSRDDASITIKEKDGGSKIILLSEKTIINKTSEATKSDLLVGGKVNVFGSANTDGSITAQNIQLNPKERP